jgi:hypothetical protein
MAKQRSSKRAARFDAGLFPLREALDSSEPRPADDASREAKKNYAERLSRQIATLIARALRYDFDGISPDEAGGRQESPARTSKGVKKLDVNYSTPELGLGLGVSIKTINYRDPKTKRYTKNYTRVDNELRAEAMDYHLRQPYAVLAAVVFLPADACDDGQGGDDERASSFGKAVKLFRNRARRTGPKEEEELLERLFIGFYEHSGARRGEARFFDVEKAPPRTGRPKELLSFEQLVREITRTYDERNKPPFEWAD